MRAAYWLNMILWHEVFMNRFLRVFSVLSLLMLGCIVPAGAQNADPAVQQIQTFYGGLLETMKNGPALGVKGRYEKLKPVIEQAYDLAAMTAGAVGPTWSSLSAADRKSLIDAFTRMTVANYAKNFDSYHGEKFPVDPKAIMRGADRYVKSQLQPVHDKPIAFTYRMHEVKGQWKIYDVLLTNDMISQLAQKRSDFAATLASGGPKELVKKINALAERMLGS
jgi:phospholipid transport system substrate-binding protein